MAYHCHMVVKMFPPASARLWVVELFGHDGSKAKDYLIKGIGFVGSDVIHETSSLVITDMPRIGDINVVIEYDIYILSKVYINMNRLRMVANLKARSGIDYCYSSQHMLYYKWY